MTIGSTFDAWATEGRDRGMEDRHWRTAKHALERMPVESTDTVLDLGCGSGYALRALRSVAGIDRGIGIDASNTMIENARTYTPDESIEYVIGSFGSLPMDENEIDHVWSMEAFYYAENPDHALEEIRRVLRPGGTFYCAVNYYEENVHSHRWADLVDVPMTRWGKNEYRSAFRAAGLDVASQDSIPDRDIEIPPAEAFPLEEWATRADMVERYRTFGTLLTVGVAR